MIRMVFAAAALLVSLPASACPFCAQDRGPEAWLIAAMGVLPVALAAGIGMAVRRMESTQDPGE